MQLVDFSKRVTDLGIDRSLIIAYSKATKAERDMIDAGAMEEGATADSFTRHMIQTFPELVQNASRLSAPDASDLSQHSPSEREEFEQFMSLAYEQARQGYEQEGVPIGAVLVSREGKVLGQGRNMRVQKGSATLHAEIAALENAGRLSAKAYEGATITQLYRLVLCVPGLAIKRVVIGENDNYVGGESLLAAEGVSVVLLKHSGCRSLMQRYIEENAEEWKEDIGEQ